MDTDQLTQQSLAALLAANEVRMKRAADKKKLREGDLSAAKILRTMPPQWENAKLYELLLPLPRVGRIKAQRSAEMFGVTLHHRLSQIDSAKRSRLARELETKGWS